MAMCDDSSPSVVELWPDIDKLDNPSCGDTLEIPSLCVCVTLRFMEEGRMCLLRTLTGAVGMKVNVILCQTLLGRLTLD
jgi:hypothetical protein